MTKDMTDRELYIFLFLQFLSFWKHFSAAYSIIELLSDVLHCRSIGSSRRTGSNYFLVIGFASGITSGFGGVLLRRNSVQVIKRAVRRSMGASTSLCSCYYSDFDGFKSFYIKTCVGKCYAGRYYRGCHSYTDIYLCAYFCSMFYNMIASIYNIGRHKTPLLFSDSVISTQCDFGPCIYY